jgi:hypothetical protein
MQREINIGEKSVTLLANAATPYYYTRTFNEEFFDVISSDPSDGKATVVFQRLAYIMACQAEGTVKAASVDGFIEWLEGFSTSGMTDATGDIADAYYGNAVSKSIPK